MVIVANSRARFWAPGKKYKSKAFPVSSGEGKTALEWATSDKNMKMHFTGMEGPEGKKLTWRT